MSSAIYRSTRAKLTFAATAALAMAGATTVQANPYASNVKITGGTNVSFVLNENADSVTYSINGGAPVSLPTTKGTQSFTLGAPTDTFTIDVGKSSTTGYGIVTGDVLAPTANGLSQATYKSGVNLISDDTNLLNKFNSPRGVSLSQNPNAPNFGVAYISNSAAGATGGRTLTGKGLYALGPDQTDYLGSGDAAQQSALFGTTTSANTPYRTYVAANGEVYVAGFGDALSGVWRMPANLSTNTQLFNGITGPGGGVSNPPLPAGQYHGSVTSVYVTGSSATGNLKVYTIDEDLSTSEATGSGSTTDTNSLWRYDVNGHDYNSGPYSSPPTKAASPLIGGSITIINDFEQGADGKIYFSQNRAQNATTSGLIVTSANGNIRWTSLGATREVLGSTAFDIMTNLIGVAVSPDQKWMAAYGNFSDIVVMPLIDGIPNILERRIVSDNRINSGRDIAFDAAGNIHTVSSGQGLYRVFSPGGSSLNTTSWNGSTYSFNTSSGVYWDLNGSTAGGGGATPSGNWDGGSVNFNANPTGGAPAVATATPTDSDVVHFTAGSDGGGSYTVTVSGQQHAHTVAVDRGTVTFSGAGTISSSYYNVAAGATAIFDLNMTGGLALGINKAGPGTMKITTDTSYFGVTNVYGGTLEMKKLNANAITNITGAGAVLKVTESAPTFPNLPSGSDAAVSQPSKLTISNGGKLDLGNNDMILNYGTGTFYDGTSPIAALRALVAQGYNGGDWLGTGISSSTAASEDAAGNFALAIVDNAELAIPFGSSNGGENFDGVDVSLQSILVKFTHRVDINMDGVVNDSDAITFSTNYEVGAPAHWGIGDLDYDGVFSDNDAIIFGTFYEVKDGPANHLPEPASVAVLGIAAAGLLGRRRRA
jgi:autotransporter-associated beta strand protein